MVTASILDRLLAICLLLLLAAGMVWLLVTEWRRLR